MTGSDRPRHPSIQVKKYGNSSISDLATEPLNRDNPGSL